MMYLHLRSMMSVAILAGTFLLASCGGVVRPIAPQAASTSKPTSQPAAGEGGEGGVEAALVSYADASQHFVISHPGPWTQDTRVKSGVQFNGGDNLMKLEFVNSPANASPMTYAKQDATTLGSSFTQFKQGDLAASTEVQGAVVLGFESQGTSTVTGKAYQVRGDRYYMQLADGRMAVLTVLGPANHYDREGVRDIALTLKSTR